MWEGREIASKGWAAGRQSATGAVRAASKANTCCDRISAEVSRFARVACVRAEALTFHRIEQGSPSMPLLLQSFHYIGVA